MKSKSFINRLIYCHIFYYWAKDDFDLLLCLLIKKYMPKFNVAICLMCLCFSEKLCYKFSLSIIITVSVHM